eukprot:RCo021736
MSKVVVPQPWPPQWSAIIAGMKCHIPSPSVRHFTVLCALPQPPICPHVPNPLLPSAPCPRFALPAQASQSFFIALPASSSITSTPPPLSPVPSFSLYSNAHFFLPIPRVFVVLFFHPHPCHLFYIFTFLNNTHTQSSPSLPDRNPVSTSAANSDGSFE